MSEKFIKFALSSNHNFKHENTLYRTITSGHVVDGFIQFYVRAGKIWGG